MLRSSLVKEPYSRDRYLLGHADVRGTIITIPGNALSAEQPSRTYMLHFLTSVSNLKSMLAALTRMIPWCLD
jgi:hypothetical protein